MWALNRDAKTFAQFIGPACVIGMPMRQHDLFDLAAGFPDDVQQTVDIAARIDEGTFVGFGAPDDGAVLLKRSHRDDGGADRWFRW